METANTIAAINETTGLAPAADGVVMLETALIDPNPANPRRDVGDVGELADSIRAQGIRQNLLVVPAPEGRFTLVIGHRRLAAAKLAGLERVPAVVAELDEREQRELMLVENSQRTDLTVVEEADGYQGLLDLGSSVEEAARKTGRSVSLVRRRFKVAAIDDDVRSHVGAAQLSIEDWETIADYEAWPDLQERLAKAAGGRNWNMAVREARTEREWREWLTSARATLAGLGIEPIEEELSETGQYSCPEGLRALERHTSGDIGEAVAEWREEFGNDPVVGIRALTWGRAVVFYREVDEQAEAEAKREREERFAAEREERERAEAPARGFADASRELRLTFVSHLMELKGQPKGMGRAVALLASRFTLAVLTEGFSQWNSNADDIWASLTQGVEATSGDDGDGDFDPLRLSGEAMIKRDPARAALGLLVAAAEDAIDWTTWRDPQSIDRHAAPLYEALDALGYRQSESESDALNGSLIPSGADGSDTGEAEELEEDAEPWETPEEGSSEGDEADDAGETGEVGQAEWTLGLPSV